MEVRGFSVGPVQANAYLLLDAGRAVLIDPGAEPERLLRALASSGATLEAVWLTHADFDHVGALAAVLDAYPGMPVLLHPADLPLLQNAEAQAGAWGLAIDPPPTATSDLADGQTLRLGDLEARCLFTPGHTPGHMAFHLPAEGVVFTGDALFQGSIGRTDRPFGDGDLLLRSIREKLLTLPDATRVLPGHGPATTILAERRSNPFLIEG